MSGIVAQNVGRSSGLIKAAAGGGGTWVEIKSLTASSSATLSFVNGSSDVVLDSTYPVYCFRCINIHPASDGAHFTYNGSSDGGSNYNVTKTTAFWNAYHAENGSDNRLTYFDTHDLAQATGEQNIALAVGADNDQSTVGELYLFDPSSTTFVKHWFSQFNSAESSDFLTRYMVSGYFNTTSAINAVQFKMSSGNVDTGKIKLFGIKDS